jgi:hypothetical protein
MSKIDEAMVQDLLDADAALIASVKKALAGFDAAPPAGWRQWPAWRKPDPWRDTVLPNLERYRQGAEDGLHEFRAGNVKRAFQAAQGQMGLTKKLEFDFSWMPPEHQNAIRDAIDRVSEVADTIWRIGHAEGLARP